LENAILWAHRNRVGGIFLRRTLSAFGTKTDIPMFSAVVRFWG
jgi:hypothetical protein